MLDFRKVIYFCFFVVGAILSIYPALTQSIWLDEVYSLYFASNFTPSQLLFHLNDVHPGGYYLFLKLILNLTTNLFLLRLITSTVPFLLAGYIVFRRKKSLYPVFFLLFNPFFIHSIWQLRMYGVCLLITVIIADLFFSKTTFVKKAFFSLLALFFSFNFIIPIACLSLYSLVIHRQKKTILIIPLIVLSFFVVKGPNYKAYAEKAAWIRPPSFYNIPSVINTVTGLEIDTQNVYSPNLWYCLLFYLIFTPLVFYVTRSNPKLAYGFTLPLFLTIVISITFPIISQHYFFHLFVPNISIFLPRYLIPIFAILLFEVFSQKGFCRYCFVIFACLSWVKTYFLINYRQYNYPATPPPNTSDTIVLPPWDNLRLANKFSKNDLTLMSQKYDLARDLESQLLQFPPNCQIYHQIKNITYQYQAMPSLKHYQLQLQQAISTCTKSP